MPMPPLWTDSVPLADATKALAAEATLGETETRALLVVLGFIIGDGEPSYVNCLRRVADLIAEGPDAIIQAAAEYERREGRSPSAGSGPKPEQQSMRWDMNE
jgi:hypothetical protein